jgi:hypothetical protein
MESAAAAAALQARLEHQCDQLLEARQQLEQWKALHHQKMQDFKDHLQNHYEKRLQAVTAAYAHEVAQIQLQLGGKASKRDGGGSSSSSSCSKEHQPHTAVAGCSSGDGAAVHGSGTRTGAEGNRLQAEPQAAPLPKNSIGADSKHTVAGGNKIPAATAAGGRNASHSSRSTGVATAVVDARLPASVSSAAAGKTLPQLPHQLQHQQQQFDTSDEPVTMLASASALLSDLSGERFSAPGGWSRQTVDPSAHGTTAANSQHQLQPDMDVLDSAINISSLTTYISDSSEGQQELFDCQSQEDLHHVPEEVVKYAEQYQAGM